MLLSRFYSYVHPERISLEQSFQFKEEILDTADLNIDGVQNLFLELEIIPLTVLFKPHILTGYSSISPTDSNLDNIDK